MSFPRLNRAICRYLLARIPIVFIIITIMAFGIIMGSLSVNLIEPNERLELENYLNTFFDQLENQSNMDNLRIFIDSLWRNIKNIMLIYIFGISIIGLPFILILLFIRSYTLGFTIGFFIEELAYNGMILVLISIFPQNLLLIPAMMLSALAGISFSITFIKSKTTGHEGHLSKHLMIFTLIIMCMGLVIVIASLIEAFITPVFIRLFEGILLNN